MTAAGTRTAVLWVPDWPVVAAMAVAGVDAHVPAAVLTHQGVVAASAVARSAGVRRGMRRRVARERCPELELLAADDARDAREFEPVAVAAETVVAGIEVARPGLLLLPAGGAARYHGTEEQLALALVEAVSDAGFESQVGLADGILAAVLAARDDAVVPPGGSGSFLAPRPTADLLHAVTSPGGLAAVRAAVDLWWRLGVRTLGDLASLPETAVLGRFGGLGAWAQRLARGEDLRPPARRRPEEDVVVDAELDPPALRVDVAAFAARRLAEELHALLSRRGLACGRLRITARTEEGELERVWRTEILPGGEAEGGMSAARITDRVRWQLEGWLTASSLRGSGEFSRRSGRTRGAGSAGREGDAEPAPIVHLTLTAEEVVPAGMHQPSLWGADAGSDARARRALGRAQGLLGGDAVLTVELQGGRDPRDRVHLVPFGEYAPPPRDASLPWPNALPAPGPATLLPEPRPVRVLTDDGEDVTVDARLTMPAPPATIELSPDEVEPAFREVELSPREVELSAGEIEKPVGEVELLVSDVEKCIHEVEGYLSTSRNEGSTSRAGLSTSRNEGSTSWAGFSTSLVRGSTSREGSSTSWGGGSASAVVGWAGPWPLDERWWEPGGRRRVLLQVVLDDGRGLLLASDTDRWLVEAVYD